MEITIPDKLVADLRRAEKVAVLTGAGVSAESGLPTFREAQTGLWSKYDPHQLASPGAFRSNPRLVWEWYAWRRSLALEATPNNGHVALENMSKMVSSFTLITQNVDGLHQRAGSRHAIELHGNITRVKCFDCGRISQQFNESDFVPPHCEFCDGLLRPDVVWFGESLPQKALSAAFTAAQNCDLFFSIGTSALVQPAALLPLEAVRNRAISAEINLEKTAISQNMDFFLPGPSGMILPALVKKVWPNLE